VTTTITKVHECTEKNKPKYTTKYITSTYETTITKSRCRTIPTGYPHHEHKIHWHHKGDGESGHKHHGKVHAHHGHKKHGHKKEHTGHNWFAKFWNAHSWWKPTGEAGMDAHPR
jgi:hypothetical protein